MSNEKRVIKLPSNIHSNELDLTSSEYYLNNPVMKELSSIIAKTKTMAICSLLYKIEDLYINTDDVIKIYQEKNQEKGYIMISELDDFGEKKETVPDLIVTNMMNYITNENNHIINTYFNDIERKEDRFKIYKKIIKDNKMPFFIEKINNWEKGVFTLKNLDVEKINIDYHEHIMIYNDGFFDFRKDEDKENYQRISKELNNLNYFYKSAEDVLKSEAFILLLQEHLYNDPTLNIEISMKRIESARIHFQHRFVNITEEDLLYKKELKHINKMSSLLNILTYEGVAECNQNFHRHTFGDKKIDLTDGSPFFSEENSIVLNAKNIKSFLTDYTEFNFNSEKRKKIINIINVNEEKYLLKKEINTEVVPSKKNRL